jgi:hypothetical protein
MQCDIQWISVTRQEWNRYLAKSSHVTLLQSYYYAQAMREVKQQGVRHGLILIDGVETGCVQAQEVSLFGKAIHGISIDRGPIWFDGYGKEKHLNAFVETLNQQFPKRFGRKRRFMFEFFSKNYELIFKNLKKNKKIADYKTYMVDIEPDLDNIRKNLKKNWRNILNKGEKNALDVEIDLKLQSLGALLSNYIKDRMQKGYAGASVKFLSSLAKYAAMENECVILNAKEDGETIASILIFIHGNGATYQIGWTTPYGRDKGAHHVLLWESIRYMKSRGITEFDLGGFNDETAGIKQFKQGLGGQEIALIGSYS